MARVYRITIYSLKDDESYMAGKLHVPGMVRTGKELIDFLDDAEYIDCPASPEERGKLAATFSGESFAVWQGDGLILEGEYLTHY